MSTWPERNLEDVSLPPDAAEFVAGPSEPFKISMRELTVQDSLGALKSTIIG
jgi:hypothetical protein